MAVENIQTSQITPPVMAKSKILFILHLPMPMHGAAMVGQYIHDSKIINEGYESHYINLATAKNLQDIGRMNPAKALSVFRLIWNVLSTVWRLRPDLVYITPNAGGMAFLKDFVVVMLLKMMGCRILAHYHNKGVSMRDKRIIDNILYRLFFPGIKVMLLSESLYFDIKKYVRREDVYFCPNGVETLADVEKDKEKNVDTDKPLRLLFLSNMMAEKGVWSLVDACRLLIEQGYNIECDFVGRWSDVDEASFNRCVEEYGIADKVRAHGARYGAEKDEFFRNADVFVFPSSYFKECFPLVVLEAMSYGLPCISTEEGAIPDIIEEGKTGFVINSRSEWLVIRRSWRAVSGLLVEERVDKRMIRRGTKWRKTDKVYDEPMYVSKFTAKLAICIRKLAEDPQLLNDMSRAARQKFCDMYSLQQFEHRFRSIIDDALGK